MGLFSLIFKAFRLMLFFLLLAILAVLVFAFLLGWKIKLLLLP